MMYQIYPKCYGLNNASYKSMKVLEKFSLDLFFDNIQNLKLVENIICQNFDMKLDNVYHLENSNYSHDLYFCIRNVSADASFGFLPVFHVEIGSPRRTSNRKPRTGKSL